MPPCRIAIACQQGLIRALLRNIVSDAVGVKITAEACSAFELLGLLKNSVADLVLIDIDILKTHGMKTIRQIKLLIPAIKILTVHRSKPHVSHALSLCVDGCFSIEHARGELQKAIETIQPGRVEISNSAQKPSSD
jgi:DNA-binding NarL/FixJ family response regulator